MTIEDTGSVTTEGSTWDGVGLLVGIKQALKRIKGTLRT